MHLALVLALLALATGAGAAPLGGNAAQPKMKALFVSTHSAPDNDGGDSLPTFDGSLGANTTASGAYATAMGVSTTASGDGGATAMGRKTIASGDYGATAMGYETTASGDVSTAMGDQTTASGDVSTAMGIFSKATETAATAMGDLTSASGKVSTAMGLKTIASGYVSTAMGIHSIADTYAETVVGMFSARGKMFEDSDTIWHGEDAIFRVGVGTHKNNRSDALTVYKNGTVSIPKLQEYYAHEGRRLGGAAAEEKIGVLEAELAALKAAHEESVSELALIKAAHEESVSELALIKAAVAALQQRQHA